MGAAGSDVVEWELDLGAIRPLERVVIWGRRGEDGTPAGLRVTVLDAERRPVFGAPLSKEAKSILQESYPQRDTNRFGLLEAKVEAPLLWSAETPHLYTLVLSLVDPKGAVVQAASARIGFREVEARGGRVLTVPLREGLSTTRIVERIRAGLSAQDP